MVGLIGSLGEIEFQVSEHSVHTFQDLTFNHQANFAEHKIINSRGLLEFTGENAQSCSIKIILDSDWGVNPQEEINKLRDIFEQHQAVPLILAGEVQGRDLWVIDNMNISLTRIGAQGEIFRAELSLSLKEYFQNL